MNKVSQSQKEKESNKNFTIGRDAFAKISAVEGIYLTKDMRKDFQTFEQKASLLETAERQSLRSMLVSFRLCTTQ